MCVLIPRRVKSLRRAASSDSDFGCGAQRVRGRPGSAAGDGNAGSWHGRVQLPDGQRSPADIDARWKCASWPALRIDDCNSGSGKLGE